MDILPTTRPNQTAVARDLCELYAYGKQYMCRVRKVPKSNTRCSPLVYYGGFSRFNRMWIVRSRAITLRYLIELFSGRRFGRFPIRTRLPDRVVTRPKRPIIRYRTESHNWYLDKRRSEQKYNLRGVRSFPAVHHVKSANCVPVGGRPS